MSKKTYSIRLLWKKNWKVILILLITFVISCLSILLISGILTGPITFADEYLYLNLAKTIHFEHGYKSDAQYNPLYPLLISFFYSLKSQGAAYDGIKIFNACIFSSTIFPVYILGRKLLKSKALCLFLSAAFLFFPWRSCTTVVWAEPLYYPLFAWTMVAAYQYFERGKRKNLILFSFLAGGLFLAKQAGILLLFSTVLTVLIFDIINRAGRKALLKNFLYGLLPGLACVIIWLALRRIFPGEDATGYQVEVDRIKDNLFNIKDILVNLAFNISYYSIASFFAVGALFLYTLLHLKKLEKVQQMFSVNVFLCTGMLMILCTFHYIGESMPFGRYQTSVLPYIFLIGAMGYENLKLDKRILSVINILLLVITLLFNPIYSFLSVKGYFNQPDIAIWTKLLVRKGNIPFHLLREEAESLLNHPWEPQIVVFLYFCVSVVIFLLLQGKWNRVAVCLMCLATGVIIAGGIHGHYAGTAKIAGGGTPVNDMYRYLEKQKVSSDQVYKTNAGIGNLYLDALWLPGLNWIEHEDYKSGSIIPVKDAYNLLLNEQLRFDFGGEVSPEAEGRYAVKAPWLPGYYYAPETGNIGFDAKRSFNNEKGSTSIFSMYDETVGDDMLCDGIGGESENTFTVYAEEGNYSIDIVSDPGLMKNSGNVDFEVYVNGKYMGEISGNNKRLTTEKFYNRRDTIEIKLVPENGEYWLLCGLDIIPEKPRTFHKAYLLAMKDSAYPLPCVYENKLYRIYYRE